MQRVVELPFDMEMMRMPWQDFLDMLVERYGAVGFVCGDDFVKFFFSSCNPAQAE